VGVELVALLAVFTRRARPVDLEQRLATSVTRRLYFFQDAIGFGELVGVEIGDVFVPHAAQLDPVQAKIVGGDRAYVVEILRYFVVDDGKAERTAGQNSVVEIHCERGLGKSRQGARCSEAPRTHDEKTASVSPAAKQTDASIVR